MPMSNSATIATSVATASIATSSTARSSAAMEWAAPLPRTYFVGGSRVEHVRDTHGNSSWTCDCEEFKRGNELGCQHTQRIAAAAELDKLLRTPGLIMPTRCY